MMPPRVLAPGPKPCGGNKLKYKPKHLLERKKSNIYNIRSHIASVFRPRRCGGYTQQQLTPISTLEFDAGFLNRFLWYLTFQNNYYYLLLTAPKLFLC